MSRKDGMRERARFRLLVALPACVFIFVLGGVAVVSFFLETGFFPHIFSSQYVEHFPIVILILIILVLAGNLCAGLYISYRLRRLIEKTKNLIYALEDSYGHIQANTELGVLSGALEEVEKKLNAFLQELIKSGQIFDSLPKAEICLSEEGEIVKLNRKATSLLHLDPLRAIGENITDIIPQTEESKLFYDLIAHGFQGRSVSPRPVPIPFKNQGKNKAGHAYWVTISPAREGLEPIKEINIAMTDRLHLLGLQNEINNLERMAEMGQIAASIAHEVRNPLGSIRVFTELVQEDFDPDDPHKRYTEEVIKQVDHLNLLIEDILAFSRDSLINLTEVDLCSVLSRAISTGKNRYSHKSVEVHESYCAHDLKIMGDPEKLTQAFVNFIVNAFDVSSENGRIDVTAEYRTGEMEGRKSICVSIVDRGRGIPPEDMAKIFRPFFTTKRNGTGLGLSLSHHIITAHGGKIEVFSQLQQGTTFCVTFPEKTFQALDNIHNRGES